MMFFCLPNCHWRRRRSSRVDKERERSPGWPEPNSIFIHQIASDGSSSSSFSSPLEITMAEFLRATDNFSADRIISFGRFGPIYRANLPTGATVAVNRLRHERDSDHRRAFHAEMDCLCKLRHPNVIKILGFFSTSRDLIVIYEYAENGSLRQWLHGSDQSSPEKLPEPLDWDRRMKITKAVAEGLRYLHELETPIVYRAISSANVLLGADFGVRIADFGLARMIDSMRSHVSTDAAGPIGYMAPEYGNGIIQATMRADVYSFGVLMIEIATGMKPNKAVLVAAAGGGEEEVGLVEWVQRMVAEGREVEMVDAKATRGEGRGLQEEEIRKFFIIACLCASDNFIKRPSMKGVVKLLEKVRK